MKKYLFIGLTIFAVILGASFAWYIWSSQNNVVVKTKVCTPEITFVGGEEINASNLKPVFKKEDGIVKDIEISLNNDCGTSVYANIYLSLDVLPEELQDDSFAFELWQDDEMIYSDVFSNYSEGDEVALLEDYEIDSDSAKFTLYIYIDANMDNDASMSGQEFKFTLHGEGTGAITSNLSAADYITNLYLENKDGTVTNNSIEYSIAPSVGLMNDRLGGTTESLDGGNIRYYGANPNNYVWLGDYYTENMTISRGISDYGSFEECMENRDSSVYCQEDIEVHAGDKKLWRIIGVFNNKLKLVTDNIISTQGLSWDTSASTVNNGHGINEWSQSDLMKLLNPGYEEESVNNSLYWNKGTGTVYTTWRNGTTSNISFANTGLSESEKNMIEEATWYTGAYDNWSYADIHYKKERENMGKICSSGTNCNDAVTRTNEWNGKVGLISASDYGYSVDLNSCSYTLDEYYYDDCANNNWLVNGTWYWTMSPRAHSYYASNVFGVSDYGDLYDVNANKGASVRPAVYVKSGVSISGGNGSGSDPYELSY